MRNRTWDLRIPWQNIRARNAKVWGSIPHGDSEFFSFSHARDKTKNIFNYFFSVLKTYYLALPMDIGLMPHSHQSLNMFKSCFVKHSLIFFFFIETI